MSTEIKPRYQLIQAFPGYLVPVGFVFERKHAADDWPWKMFDRYPEHFKNITEEKLLLVIKSHDEYLRWSID